jgi:acetyl esterase/lipase
LAQKVKQHQGAVVLSVWEAMWHVWHGYPDLPEAQQAIEEIRDFLYQQLPIVAHLLERLAWRAGGDE